MTGIYYDDLFLEHNTGAGHPERADRLRSVMRVLRENLPENAALKSIDSAAPVEAIQVVHPGGYVDNIIEACERAPMGLDPDTVVSTKSYDAARLAAGAGLAATDAVMAGELRNAFCCVRPPGHHAEPDTAMGFCLFNNIAVAARALQKNHGVERVLIIDWDVHHGNGTQAAFDDDPSVYFVSLHQWPLYPGTGRPEETGAGKGKGFNRNIIFPPQTDGRVFIPEFQKNIEEIFSRFKPEFVLISAGFDAHARDPLAELRLQDDDFGVLTQIVLDLANVHAQNRVVSFLEGGYDLTGLSNSVLKHVEVLAA